MNSMKVYGGLVGGFGGFNVNSMGVYGGLMGVQWGV